MKFEKREQQVLEEKIHNGEVEEALAITNESILSIIDKATMLGLRAFKIRAINFGFLADEFSSDLADAVIGIIFTNEEETDITIIIPSVLDYCNAYTNNIRIMLRKLEIYTSKNNGNNIKVIGGTFRNISYLFEGLQTKTLDLTEFNFSNVEKMDSTFEGLQAEELLLPSIKHNKLISMKSCFEYTYICSINKIDINTSNVKDMSKAFDHFTCQGTNVIELNLESVRNIEMMFAGSVISGKLDLTKTHIPNRVTNCKLGTIFLHCIILVDSMIIVNIDTYRKIESLDIFDTIIADNIVDYDIGAFVDEENGIVTIKPTIKAIDYKEDILYDMPF